MLFGLAPVPLIVIVSPGTTLVFDAVTVQAAVVLGAGSAREHEERRCDQTGDEQYSSHHRAVNPPFQPLPASGTAGSITETAHRGPTLTAHVLARRDACGSV